MLFRKRNRTVFYGTENLSSLAPRIWELIPQSLKGETELSQLKTKIKTWTTKCPCRLCKKYIHHLFIHLFIIYSFIYSFIFLRDGFKMLM